MLFQPLDKNDEDDDDDGWMFIVPPHQNGLANFDELLSSWNFAKS